MRELAEETGLNYSTLRAWSAGTRTPNREGVRKLADAMERRGGQLEELAERLREVGEGR